MPVLDERVVVLAPSAHDGPVTGGILEMEGFHCVVVAGVEELCGALREGAAVALVAEEALPPSATSALTALLEEQEPWSDLPVILFTGRGRPPLHPRLATLAASANVTLLERPVERITLLSAVRAALRGRRRQYAARGILTALQQTTEHLREADHRKSEFLAVLSHELRNPLGPIRNSIFLLERVPGDGEQARRAKQILRRQTEHLAHLVDDLLDVTRISVGKVELQRMRLDLREVVRRTADDLRSVFVQGGVGLEIEYASSGPAWVDADPTRMAQILGNLLQNAAKFTPRGGSVAVTLDASDGAAELRVRDDGAGMEPATIERMFEPFTQADRTLARSSGGLGLGLSLVRGLVQLHGGTVTARSEGLGRGAEFVVRIPLASPTPGAGDALGPGAASSRTILVVEDNDDGAQSLADVLELQGHRVRIAADGRTGIALARELRPDIVLCDIGLPDLDGYAVARALRAEEALHGLRLVALSGYAQPEDRQRAREAGFDAHLAKPPDVAALLRVIAAEPV